MIAIIAGIISIIIGSIIFGMSKIIKWKLILAFVITLLAPYIIVATIIGYPSPYWLTTFNHMEVLQVRLIENKAIYLWVIPEGKTIPISIQLPWSVSTANKIIEQMNISIEKGTGTYFKNIDGSIAPWDKPVEALPNKGE